MTSPFDIERRSRFQHGLVTQEQLTEAGASRGNRRTLVRHGILRITDHGVYRALGAAPDWRQDLLAACLAAGPDALASHRAAALLWDLVDPPAPIEITVPYPQRPLPVKAVRHRSQALREKDRAVRQCVPVTSPTRTMLDLGAVAPTAVPQALERCLFQRLLTTAALWQIVAELGKPGRRGVRPLRTALEARALGDERPESLLEVVAAEVLAATGVRFEYQLPLLLDGRRYRLDFAAPHVRLAIEADGLSAHSSREALDSDLDRQNRLVRHGWMVLRYTHTHLKQRRAQVRAEIVEAVRHRSSLFEPSWSSNDHDGSKSEGRLPA